jgi:hypothetical protein
MAYIINNEDGVRILNGTSSNDNSGFQLPVVGTASSLSTVGAVAGTILFDNLSKQIYRYTGTAWLPGSGTSGSA